MMSYFIGVEDYSKSNNFVFFQLFWKHKSFCGGIHNFKTGRTYLKANKYLKQKEYLDHAYQVLMTNDLHEKVTILSPDVYDIMYKKFKKQ